MTYYVTMTDKFSSGFRCLNGKINKLVFICETLEEAEIVEQNAKARTDMTRVCFSRRRPYYNKNRYLTQFKTKDEYGCWYQKGYFL